MASFDSDVGIIGTGCDAQLCLGEVNNFTLCTFAVYREEYRRIPHGERSTVYSNILRSSADPLLSFGFRVLT